MSRIAIFGRRSRAGWTRHISTKEYTQPNVLRLILHASHGLIAASGYASSGKTRRLDLPKRDRASAQH